MSMRAGPSDDVSRAGATAEITRTRTQGSTVAEAERDRVVEAMKNGESRYRIKPFSPSATAAKLKEFLSETSTRRTSKTFTFLTSDSTKSEWKSMQT